jgi:hypothetical protein
MGRINYKFANSPIVFVAPHGHPSDDLNTDLIAKFAAKEKLWEVFQEINNLDAPVLDIEPLGWKDYA